MTPLRSRALAGCVIVLVACSDHGPGGTPVVVCGDGATAPLLSTTSLIQWDPKATSYTKGRPDELVYPILSAQGDGPTYGPGSLDWHNYDGRALRGGARGRPVTMPLEVSAVRLRLRDVMQHGGASTGPVTLELLAWDGVTSIGSVSCVPTAVATDCVSGAISVTGGVEYIAQIAVNPSGTQSSFLASRFSVEPVAASAPFWVNGFVRLDADNLQWGANALPGSWSNPRRPDALAFSELQIESNAATLYVETWADTHDYVASGGDADTRASFSVATGSGSVAYVPENTGGLAARERAVSFVSVANTGAGGAPSAVTITSGAQVVSVYPPPAAENRGVYLAAVYAPASSCLTATPPPPPYVVGATDSKGIAYPSSPLTSAATLLRRRGYAVDWWGAGGDTLGNHVPAASVAAAWPFAQLVAGPDPALVLLELQRNDWTGGVPSETICGELQSAYDAVDKAAPATRFRVLQITKEASELSVGGVAWDTHRANVEATACAGDSAVDGQPRAEGCSVVRTDGLWTSAECEATTCAVPAECSDPWCGCGASRCAGDRVHLADAGFERQDRLLSGEAFPVPGVLLGDAVLGWWEADSGIGGGPAGAIVAGGPSPPTLTVQGTGARAIRLATEVAGVTGGVVTLRISYDGGESWPEKGTFTTKGGTLSLPLTAGLSPLGYRLSFPAGSYDNLHTWRFDSQGGAWADLSARGTTLGLAFPGHYPGWSAANSGYGEQPTSYVPCKASQACWKSPALSHAPPYWIAFVGAMDSTTPKSAYLGRLWEKTGIAASVRDATTMSFTDGVSTLTSGPTTPASPHCVVLDYQGSGRSTIYVDGVVSASGPMSGGAALQGFNVGYDAPSGDAGNPTIAAIAVGGGTITPDQVRGLCARSAFKYATP